MLATNCSGSTGVVLNSLWNSASSSQTALAMAAGGVIVRDRGEELRKVTLHAFGGFFCVRHNRLLLTGA